MYVDISEEFDMSPIRPSLVKSCLKKCSSSSSPGPDGISYFHLKKLPSTHLFLATLYTKILLHSHEAPTNWCSADIILLPKGGDPSKPENFRPIAKTTTVAKLYHKILAKCLENYFSVNGIIDTTVQKGFLTGSNGIMEHIDPCSANHPQQCKGTPPLTGYDPYRSKECIWFCQPQSDLPNVGIH